MEVSATMVAADMLSVAWLLILLMWKV